MIASFAIERLGQAKAGELVSISSMIKKIIWTLSECWKDVGIWFDCAIWLRVYFYLKSCPFWSWLAEEDGEDDDDNDDDDDEEKEVPAHFEYRVNLFFKSMNAFAFSLLMIESNASKMKGSLTKT